VTSRAVTIALAAALMLLGGFVAFTAFGSVSADNDPDPSATQLSSSTWATAPGAHQASSTTATPTPPTTRPPATSGTTASPTPNARGAQIYASVCAVCHGDDREGGTGPELTASAMIARYPDIDSQISDVLEGSGDMDGFAGTFTEEEIRDVVLYTRQP
jgi:mono/diheme cytochrome c family protein